MQDLNCTANAAIIYINKMKLTSQDLKKASVLNYNKQFGTIFELQQPRNCKNNSEEIKEILEKVNEGMTVKDVAKQYNISVGTIYRWNKTYKIFKSIPETRKENAQKLKQKLALEENQK